MCVCTCVLIFVQYLNQYVFETKLNEPIKVRNKQIKRSVHLPTARKSHLHLGSHFLLIRKMVKSCTRTVKLATSCNRL